MPPGARQPTDDDIYYYILHMRELPWNFTHSIGFIFDNINMDDFELLPRIISKYGINIKKRFDYW
jgi:hypothetical protein